MGADDSLLQSLGMRHQGVRSKLLGLLHGVAAVRYRTAQVNDGEGQQYEDDFEVRMLEDPACATTFISMCAHPIHLPADGPQP
jgi:hypothetical protein